MNLSFANSPTVPKCRYLVSLSDGSTVFEDNNLDMPTTWIRLIEYIQATKLKINRIRVQCSANMTNVPVGDGYFVFHKEDYGAFSRILKGIGVFSSSTNKLTVYFFDVEGNVHSIEERDIESDHPGLIIS